MTVAALSPARSRAAGNPWLVAAVVVVPTFMEVLDTTIAVVALRYIAGGLSATVDAHLKACTLYTAPLARSESRGVEVGSRDRLWMRSWLEQARSPVPTPRRKGWRMVCSVPPNRALRFRAVCHLLLPSAASSLGSLGCLRIVCQKNPAWNARTITATVSLLSPTCVRSAPKVITENSKGYVASHISR